MENVTKVAGFYTVESFSVSCKGCAFYAGKYGSNCFKVPTCTNVIYVKHGDLPLTELPMQKYRVYSNGTVIPEEDFEQFAACIDSGYLPEMPYEEFEIPCVIFDYLKLVISKEKHYEKA